MNQNEVSASGRPRDFGRLVRGRVHGVLAVRLMDEDVTSRCEFRYHRRRTGIRRVADTLACLHIGDADGHAWDSMIPWRSPELQITDSKELDARFQRY